MLRVRTPTAKLVWGKTQTRRKVPMAMQLGGMHHGRSPHSPIGKVKEEAAPGFTLAGFSRCFSWWDVQPVKMIADDVHLRRHQDRKLGNLLLQLLVASDSDDSRRKTCKNDDDDDDDDDDDGSSQPSSNLQVFHQRLFRGPATCLLYTSPSPRDS